MKIIRNESTQRVMSQFIRRFKTLGHESIHIIRNESKQRVMSQFIRRFKTMGHESIHIRYYDTFNLKSEDDEFVGLLPYMLLNFLISIQRGTQSLLRFLTQMKHDYLS